MYPYESQIPAIKYMLKHHYLILNGAMGTGKTLMSIAVMCLTPGRKICIVPSFLKHNWKSEIEKVCNLKVKVFNKGEDYDSTDYDWDVAIISYHFISRADHLFRQCSTYCWDEAHYLCSITAQRTQAAHEVIERYKPERVLLLSGTPIKSRVSEFYSLLALCSYNNKDTSGVDISISYPDLWSFQNTFQYKTEFRVGRRRVVKFEGTRNIPELKRLLHHKMFSLKLEDVAEIPAMQDIEVMVSDMELFKEEDLELGSSDHVMKRKAKAALTKAKYTKEYVNDLLSSGNIDRVLVFTDHIKSAIAICNGIKGAGYIDGSTSSGRRVEIIKDLCSGKLSCVVSTIMASNTGHTIVECADIVFNDCNWLGSEMLQAKKRIHRIGQTKKCRFHYILSGKMDKLVKKNIEKGLDNIKEFV